MGRGLGSAGLDLDRLEPTGRERGGEPPQPLGEVEPGPDLGQPRRGDEREVDRVSEILLPQRVEDLLDDLDGDVPLGLHRRGPQVRRQDDIVPLQ